MDFAIAYLELLSSWPSDVILTAKYGMVSP